MLLKFSPPVVNFSRAAPPSMTARTLVSRGGDAGPEHANCCSKAAFLPSLTVLVMEVSPHEIKAHEAGEKMGDKRRDIVAYIINSIYLPLWPSGPPRVVFEH